jgi:hypothetical protein
VIRSIHVQYMIVMRIHTSVYPILYMNDVANTSSESKHRIVRSKGHGGVILGLLVDDLQEHLR